MKPKLNLKLAAAFPVIARAMSTARGNLAKRLGRSRRLQISLVILLIFLPLALLGLWLGREKAIASWFDDNFAYRQTVTITNSGSSQTDYQLPISLDTATLITAGKMRSDCYDIRVTNYGGDLLPLWIETGTNACNTATTQIWVKVPSIPTPNNVLLIYYGNSTVTTGTNGLAPSSAEAGKSVFESFDTFDTLDTSKWTVTGSPTTSGGAVALTNGQTLVTSSTVTSSSGLARVIARVKQAATTQTAGKIGLYNTNDAASIGFGNLEEKLSQIVPSNIISHHKLEETTSTDANQFKASGYLDTGKLSQAVSMYGNAAGTTGSTLTFNRGAQISGNNYEHFNNNQGSISFWFKPNWNGNDSLAHIIFTSNTVAAGSSVSVYKNTGNNLVFRLEPTEGKKAVEISVSSSITSGNWYHVLARWDFDNVVSGSNYLDIWLNNSQTTAGSGSPTTSGTPYAPAGQLFIGSDANGTSQAQALIDDFAIFDRVLTTTEITNIYNSGTGREAGYVADSSLKFYAKMDGSGTLSPVTYNGGATFDNTAYNASTNTNGNMITNGNMEAASGGLATSWSNFGGGNSNAADAETANIGFDTRSQKISPDSGWTGIMQTISFSPNTTYALSFWYKVTAGTYIEWTIDQGGGGGQITAGDEGSASTWTRYETTFKTGATTGADGYITLRSGSGQTDLIAYFDNVSLTPNLVDNGGMEGTYASGVAPGWVKSGTGTLTEETTTYHSGSKAQRITTDGSASDLAAGQQISVTANTSYLLSFWVYSDTTAVQYSFTGAAAIVNITAGQWNRVSVIEKAPTTTSPWLFLQRRAGQASKYWIFDDVSVIPLDNTALSFQSWAPVPDAASADNDLSIHGDSDGVSSNTSGKLNNAYTFDGSTGYLRQKTYLTNIGTLSYGTNALTDTGQTFTSYKASPATYMIVVTNSDNTTSWGYIGTTSGATIVDVFTTKALSVAGWNGTSPSGKTPVGYEVRKTDYQITGGDFSYGMWLSGSTDAGVLMEKKCESCSSNGYDFSLWTEGTTFFIIVGNTNGSNYDFLNSNVSLQSGWQFVTVTYKKSTGLLSFYFNGVLDNSKSSYTSIYDGYGAFSIGGRRTSSSINSYFSGSIDSPFVLNTALTADQIAALYQYHSLATTNNATISVINGSATPTNDTNYHTYLLTAGSSSTTASSDNTVFATSSTNIPNEAVNLRLMNSDATNALTVDWVAVAKQASTAPTVAAPASEEKGGAPVAYWKFNDGTGQTAHDSTSSQNNGTLGTSSDVDASDPAWQTEDMCVSGKCLKFDGTDDNASIPDPSNDNLDFGIGSFTVSAWVKPKSGLSGTSNYYQIIGKKANYNGSNIGWQAWLDYRTTSSSGVLQFRVNDGSTATDLSPMATGNLQSLFDGSSWRHVSWVVNVGNNVTFYVDGVARGSQSISNMSGTLSNSQSVYVGGNPNGYYFPGFIDETKIYNYARTAAQVKSDFASRGSSKGSSVIARSAATWQSDALSNGLVGYWKMDEASWTNDCSTTSVTDSSGNANNGKSCPNGSGISTPAAGKFGLSGSFDGVDDYVNLGNPTVLNPTLVTVSAWFKTSSSSLGRIFRSRSYGYSLLINSAGTGRVSFSVNDSSTNAITINSTTATYNDGNWHLLTGTYDGTKANLFVDGAFVSSTNGSGTGSVFYSTNTNGIAIGRDGDASSAYFTGSIDDVRIYNRALSPKEVRDLYNWAPGPRVYLKMEEGSGTATNDDSGNARTGTLNGNPIWAPGKYGKGVKLDGTGDYTQVTDF